MYLIFQAGIPGAKVTEEAIEAVSALGEAAAEEGAANGAEWGDELATRSWR